jgi:hypothetical protein
MSKFTVAGVSKCKDQVKVRFCSDKILRIKNLQKQGDEDIQLIDLPNEMTKEEACKYLLSLDEFKDFHFDIGYVMSQKKLTVTKKSPIIKISEVEEDKELESIKELAAA